MKGFNPYYAYIEFETNNFSINNIDNGAISLQSVMKGSSLNINLQVYDDTAHLLAEAIMASEVDEFTVRYGYSESDSLAALNCRITEIHTELTGHGETLIINAVPSYLYEVLTPVQQNITKIKYYKGKVSDIFKQVVTEIGWQVGYIEETYYQPPSPDYMPGENNGNDNLSAPEDYYYWDADKTVMDFMEDLRKNAVVLDGDRLEGDYIINIDYFVTPPKVDFCRLQNLPSANDMSEEKEFVWVYGDPESEIVSLSVDWGKALMANIGQYGSIVMNQDSISNGISTSSQQSGYLQQDLYSANTFTSVDELPYTGSKLTPKMGYVIGPQGSETYYGGLSNSSSAYTETIRQHPEMAMWSQSVRDDGVLTFGGYVVVAGSISGTYEDGQYHQGTHNRGDIVDTSLGKGIIIDGCYRSVTSSTEHFDIAVSKESKYGWYK